MSKAFDAAWSVLKALPEQQMFWPGMPHPVHVNPSAFNETLRGIPVETLMEEGFKPDKHRPRIYDDAPISARPLTDFRMVGRNRNQLAMPNNMHLVSEGTIHPAIHSMAKRKLIHRFPGHPNLDLTSGDYYEGGWDKPLISRTPQQNMADYDRAREQSQSAERT